MPWPSTWTWNIEMAGRKRLSPSFMSEGSECPRGKRNPAREELDAHVREADFQKQVIQVAERFGWLVYHTYDSRRCAPGFPDLVLVKGSRVIFAELKSHRGRLTPEQKAWIEALERAEEVEAMVWKPKDWRNIERILRGEEHAREQGPQIRPVPHRYWQGGL